VESGVAPEFNLPAGRNRVAVSGSAIGRAQGRPIGGNTHSPADAIVVLDSPNHRAIAAQGCKRDSISLSQGFLQSQPSRERVVPIHPAEVAADFLDW